MKKKVFLNAYFNNNLGDDLFVKILLERYPSVRFYVCAPSNSLVAFKNYRNLAKPCKLLFFLDKLFRKLFHNSKSLIVSILEKKCDLILIIGGSIFMDTKNRKPLYSPNDKVKKKIITIGANFGPCYSSAFKDAIENELSHNCDVCFRDTFSYNSFSHLDNVRFAPDIVFSYNLEKVSKISKTIGISVIDLSNRNKLSSFSDIYINTISDFCKFSISKGYKIRLYSFCQNEGDDSCATSIASCLNNQNGLEIVRYNGNIDAFINDYCSNEFLLSTRFHSIVLGMLSGSSILPIVYSEKTKHVLLDLCFDGNEWDLIDGQQIAADKLFDMLIANTKQLDLSDTKANASAHFAVLDTFLL